MALDIRQEVELAAADSTTFKKSIRTLQRYKEKMTKAGDTIIEQNLALVPKYYNCGASRKITVAVIDLIKSLVNTEYNKPNCMNKKALYKIFIKKCEVKNLKPCSTKAFNMEVDRHTSTQRRKGRRVAYQERQIHWYLQYKEEIHGVRPFQFVHFDHTLADIIMKSLTLNIPMPKPWLSIATDASTRRILAFYLSFQEPSYLTCMMLLRDLVRRHGRMPDFLIVDHGPDFESNDFQRVVKLYGGHIRYRPKDEPSGGAVEERIFGTLNTQFIHILEGNTKLMKHARTVTKSINPTNFATWTLPAFHGGLDYYFDKIYGDENHPALACSPIEAFNKRIIETGGRRNKMVRYDDFFKIETLPNVKRPGTRIVDISRGVKVNYIWYSTPIFNKFQMSRQRVFVRYDPWDVSTVYVHADNKWHHCLSNLFHYKQQFTVFEFQYLINDMALKFGVKKKEYNSEMIARWTRLLKPENFDTRMREQQNEVRHIYDKLNMTSIQPPSNQNANCLWTSILENI